MYSDTSIISRTSAAGFPSTVEDVAVSNVDGPVVIGKDDTTDRWFFDGIIDDIAIYNRALSETEIMALYNQFYEIQENQLLKVFELFL